jgi:hypothetical protein
LLDFEKIEEQDDEEMEEIENQENNDSKINQQNENKEPKTEINNNTINNNINKNDEIKELREEVKTEIIVQESKPVKPRRFSMTSLQANSIDNTSLNSHQINSNTLQTNISSSKSPNLMTHIFTVNQTSTGNLLTSNISNTTATTPTPINQQNLDQNLSQYGVETTNYNELHAIMQKINTWGIEIFLLDELTMHHPLTAITYTIFQVNLFYFIFNFYIKHKNLI